jgi:ADP-ribose pyrophosphatase YjhB (NUDIX family)
MEETDRARSGAFICVFNKTFSKILLLRRNEEKRGEWGNVGGAVEPGETPVQACMREAKEEIGISLKPEDLAFICTKMAPYSGPHRFTSYFYAASIDENTRISLDHESRGYAWFDIEKLPERMMDPKKDMLDWWAIAKKSLAKG